MNNQKEIPIFFSSDDNYLPFLAVSINSLIDNCDKQKKYHIYVLNNGINQQKADKLLLLQQQNVCIEFVDVNEKLQPIREKLSLRDYYTTAIYYRLFIQSMFPNLDKAIYLDCDIAVVEDISKLFEIDLGENLLGAVQDQIVAGNKNYRNYSEIVLGLPYKQYFNSGILLMNLNGFRKQKIEDKFVKILTTYNFSTIAPDQDYLNFLCKNQVKYLELGWNKECLRDGYKGKLNIIHYALFKKPWQYDNIKYDKYFWKYAKTSNFYEEIINIKNNFPEEQKQKHIIANEALKQKAYDISLSDFTFNNVVDLNKLACQG